MSDYTEFFFNTPASVVQLDCLEITHSSFSQTFYVVRNKVGGCTVTHESAGGDHAYVYYPLKLASQGARSDLDVVYQISLGDLGEIFNVELDNIADDDAFDEKPVVKYRTYRSDDLSAPLFGPVQLEVTKLSTNEDGVSFEANAPYLNNNRTGEVYHLDRFPMLRGFL